MAGLRAFPHTVDAGVRGVLPAAAQLATLGPVLCLYRPQQGSELAGWRQAVRVEAHTGVDSDGLDERLLFFDAQDRCCWRLCLLPESDFVAWDKLLSSLPAGRDDTAGGLGDRLWRRLAGRLLGGQWRACALQLHALPQVQAETVLAASLPPMSALGLSTARRIALAEGAELDGGLDDCCCARAASDALRLRRHYESPGENMADNVVPLVRLK